MDKKTKSLIAIGAAAGANCIPCLTGLLDRARCQDIAEHDLRIAISVGQSVRKGAAGKWDEEARLQLGHIAEHPCMMSGVKEREKVEH